MALATGGVTSGGSAASQGARCTTAYANFKNAVFGSFVVLSRTIPHVNARLRLVTQGIAIVQMLSFLTADNLRWGNLPSIAWLRWISSLVSVQGWSFLASTPVYLAVFYAAIAWTSAFVLLWLYTLVGFISGDFPYLWPLKLLRSVASLTTDTLYIPVLSTLLTEFQCNDVAANPYWKLAGYSCYTGGHLAQAPIVLLLLFGMITLSAEFALLFFDASLVSRSHGARSHGRLDFLFLLIKTALSVFCKTFPTVIGVWGVIGLLLASGVVWLGGVLFWMPFLHHTANRTDAGIASVFLLGGLTVVLSQSVQGLDAGIVFMIAAPLALGAGVALADWRAKSIYLRPVAQLANPTEVALKCRYLLHEVLYGHPTDNLHGIGERAAPYLAADDGVDSVALRMTTAGATSTGAAEALRATGASTGETSAAAAEGKGLGRMDGAAASDDGEALLELARTNLPAFDATRIEGVYKAGLARFKNANSLHVAVARWYANLRGNKHMEMAHLMRATRAGSGE